MGTAFPAWETPKEYQGPLTGSHIYRDNVLTEPQAKFEINVPTRCQGMLIEGNRGLTAVTGKGVTNCVGVIRNNTAVDGSPWRQPPPVPDMVLAQ